MEAMESVKTTGYRTIHKPTHCKSCINACHAFMKCDAAKQVADPYNKKMPEPSIDQ
jgi:hypothetical protein